MLPDWRARLMICLGVWQVLPPERAHTWRMWPVCRAGLLPEASDWLMGPAGAASERRIGRPGPVSPLPPQRPAAAAHSRATSIACPHLRARQPCRGSALTWDGSSRCLPMSSSGERVVRKKRYSEGHTDPACRRALIDSSLSDVLSLSDDLRRPNVAVRLIRLPCCGCTDQRIRPAAPVRQSSSP
jgi:hypothetical protein